MLIYSIYSKLNVSLLPLGHRGSGAGNNNLSTLMGSSMPSTSSEMLSDNSCDSMSSAGSGSDASNYHDFPPSPDSWLGDSITETTN